MKLKRQPDPGIPDDLEEIERTALELAQLAGAEIVTALGTAIAVRYKTDADDVVSLRDPVSEIDRNVESLIRGRLAERFPAHDIIGEEMIERPGTNDDYVWAIDPIDGTTNFVNGFPIFGASIGVLYRGAPIVGAIWSSFTHTLRPGVYHARQDGPLSFDGASIRPAVNPEVRRRLAGSAIISSDRGRWDYRKTGSAAVECVLVAIGALEVARFAAPNIWDVAGGVALIRAAGGVVLSRLRGEWSPLTVFEPAPSGKEGVKDLANWRRALIVGATESAEAMRALERT
jgi:myo-inositol-1(or 4)-monophosphatase